MELERTIYSLSLKHRFQDGMGAHRMFTRLIMKHLGKSIKCTQADCTERSNCLNHLIEELEKCIIRFKWADFETFYRIFDALFREDWDPYCCSYCCEVNWNNYYEAYLHSYKYRCSCRYIMWCAHNLKCSSDFGFRSIMSYCKDDSPIFPESNVIDFKQINRDVVERHIAGKRRDCKRYKPSQFKQSKTFRSIQSDFTVN